MTGTSVIALGPLIVLSTGVSVLLPLIAFWRRHVPTAVVTLVTLALAGLAIIPAAFVRPAPVTALLVVDGYALFFAGLMLAAAFAVALLAHGYLARRCERPEEFYLLLLLGTLGAVVLAESRHFAAFFLGLETLSVSLYALIGYCKEGRAGVEAAVKYLVLAAASAAILVFGMALIYAEVGTLDFGRMAALTAAGVPGVVLPAGLILLSVGIGFKLALVPFHLWTPDVYVGAPAPVTAYLATVSKGAMFALFLRYFVALGDYQHAHPLLVVFSLVALFSMIVGNLLALLQTNVKRILAYSSIAHLGYLLVAFIAGGARAVTAVTFYFAAYFAATLGAFGVVTVLAGPAEEAETLEDYRGLYWRRPWLSAVLTVSVASLAGIPLTAGFIAKFYVMYAGVGFALWALVIALALTSAIGLYYYLRIVAALFAAPAAAPAARARAPLAASVALGLLLVVVVGLGVYPASLARFLEAAAASLR